MKWLRDTATLISIILILIEPKNAIVRVVLLSWIALGTMLWIQDSDWIMRRSSELSITRPRFSEHRSLFRLTAMVSLVVAVVFVFGALTWPISEPKLPPYIPIPIPNAKPAPTPTVPPETPKAKPTHKPKLQPPQPVTLQAPYGNLAARCDELGKEIIEGAEKREQSMPNPSTNRADYNDWYRENDGIFFRAQFYPYVASIHKELLSVHVDDPQLDRLIENAERNYKRRDSTDAQTVVNHPMLFHLSIREIKEIGEQLRAVATQVPH